MKKRRQASNVGATVDELGGLMAEIAELEKRAKALRDDIRAMGAGAYEGALFRATVSEPGLRFVLDTDAVREEFGDDWVQLHSKPVQSKPAVNVRAKTGEKVAA